MKTSITKSALAFALGATLMVAATQAGAENARPPIEGVWQVTRHGVNCQTGQQVNSFPALMTFHKDGIIDSDAVAPGSTAAAGTAEHGLWQREPGKENYSFRLISYGWDNAGIFGGSIEVTGSLRLLSRSRFAYDATIEIFDASGNLLATHCGQATATRFE